MPVTFAVNDVTFGYSVSMLVVDCHPVLVTSETSETIGRVITPVVIITYRGILQSSSWPPTLTGNEIANCN